jgi:hypothetical protein
MARFDNPQAWGSGQAGPGASIPGNNPTNQPPGGGAPLAGAPTPTPTPAPSQNTAPTITTDGTPQVGETMTGVNGTFSNGSVVSVAWLLNGTSMSTSQTYAPSATGSLIFRNVVTGAGGTANFDSAATTVAAATPTPSPTWNPADKNATVTLSNGNKTATQSGVGSFYNCARSTTSHSSGKYWAEYTIVKPGGANMQVGFGQSTASLAFYLGSDANSAGFGSDGNIGYGGSFNSAGFTYGDGDQIGFELDLNALQLTTYKNGVVSTNVISIGAGTWFLMLAAQPTGDGATINDTPTSFTPRAGFLPWG